MIRGKMRLKALYSFKCLIMCIRISLNLEFYLEKSGKGQKVFLSLVCDNPDHITL